MPHISTLDEVSRATLERILSTDVRALTAEDVVFLRARREYLSGEQLHNYGPVLDGENPAEQTGNGLNIPESQEPEKPTEAPKRRGARKTEAHE